MKPQSQKLFSPRKPWELFGSRGDPRLRLACVLEDRGALAEAEPLRRRVLEAEERLRGPEHRWTLIAVNKLALVLMQLGKFSEAPLMCCGGWMVLHFVLGKVGKNGRETITAFSDHLRICHLCRSAIMHEHDNFTQIISNHVMSKFGKRCLQRTDAALQVSV